MVGACVVVNLPCMQGITKQTDLSNQVNKVVGQWRQCIKGLNPATRRKSREKSYQGCRRGEGDVKLEVVVSIGAEEGLAEFLILA